MIYKNKIICIICIITLALSTSLFMIGCRSDRVNSNDNVLCSASSIAEFTVNSANLSFTIPANAAITKIYISIQQNDAINGGILDIKSPTEDIFLHRMSYDPGAAVGEFETTLVQPLCVGPEGATFTFIPTSNNVITNVQVITATVVYCPNYCTTNCKMN